MNPVPLKYQEPFDFLRRKLSAGKLFKMVYHEEKKTYHYPYFYQDYKNEITVPGKADEFLLDVRKFFDTNLFSPAERLLLMDLLTPIIREFGAYQVKTLKARIQKYQESKDKLKTGHPYDKEYQKSVDAILAVRTGLIKKFEEYRQSITPPKSEEEKFIDSWLEGTTTLSQWLDNRKVDFWETLDQHELTDEEKDAVIGLQITLFTELKDNQVRLLKDKNKHLFPEDRIYLFEMQLKIIDHFFTQGDISEISISRLSSIRAIVPPLAEDILLSYNKVLQNRYDFKKDFQISLAPKLWEHPVLTASIFKEYRNFLIEQLSTPKTKKSPIKKAPVSANLKSFGFKGDKIALKKVIVALSNKIYLLNESCCSSDDLLRVFTAEDLTQKSVHIHFECENTQISYIINRLKPHFRNLSPKLMEESKLFFSKRGTRLTAQNLYASKTDDPKNKRVIDETLRLLH